MAHKRIGLVDYHLDNFHARIYLDALRGPLADRGFQVTGATAVLAEPSREWAAAKDLPYFDSVAQLADEVDYFAILAPSNPEQHLDLCRQVFPYQRPTFVDKTFAPDYETAVQIFRLADELGLPVQSTSALRNTNIQQRVQQLTHPLRSMFITAGGSSFAEYGIHPVELAVSCLGAEVDTLTRIGGLAHPQFILQYSANRTAIIDFNEATDVPFSALVTTDEGSELVVVDIESLFVDAASAILDFFEAGTAQIDRHETLMIRRILDLAMTEEVASKFVSLVDNVDVRKTLLAPHWKHSAQEKVTER